MDASLGQLANWKAVNVADGHKEVVVWKKDPETGEVEKHDAKVRKWGPGAEKAPPEPKGQPKQPKPGEGHDADIPSREFLEPPPTGSFTGGGGRFAPGPEREQAIDLANETPGRWESQDRAERYYGAYKNLSDEAKQTYEAYDYKQEQDNYWENPQRVARYYHALQNRPPGTDALPGVDKDNIEVAYKYMEFVNGDKPWWEWDALDYDDPGRDFLASIPEPPMETMFPHERNQRMMQQGTFAGGNVPEPPDNLELGGISQEEYDNLSNLQKWFLGTTSNPAAFGATIGGTAGLVGGGPGGALGGTALGGALGSLLGTDEEGKPKHPKLADLMMYLDYSWQVLERTLGVLRLGYGAGLSALKEGKPAVGADSASAAIADVLNNLPAAWRAAHMTAESGLAQAIPGPIDIARVLSEGTGEIKEGVMQGQRMFGPDSIADDLAAVIGSTGFGGEQGVYDFYGDWREGPRPQVTGYEALTSIYEEIKSGAAPQVVYDEWNAKLGASGMVRELIGAIVLDPLDWMGLIVTEPLQLMAKLNDNKALKLATEFNAGRPVRALQDYGQFIRQGYKVADEIGDVAKYADDLTWTQRMLSGVTPEGSLRWLGQPVKDPGVLNRVSGAALSGGVGGVLGLGLFGGVGGSAGAAGATGLAAALTGFGAPAGILIGTLAGTSGWNKGITGMIGLTPSAKASQLVNNAQVNLALMLEHADNVPDEMVQMVKRLGQTDIELARELGMHSLNAPEASAIPMALRDYGKTADELIANWYAGETGRKVFDGIADALGRETKEVIAEVAQGKHVDTLFRQYLDEVAKASDESAKFILEAAEAGEFSPDVMKKWADGMVTGNMHMDANAFKADLYSSMLTHMSEWGAKWFGVEPDPAIIRFADTIKSAQSMALLGLNPGYFVNNVINNTVTAVAEGAFGLRTAGEIDDVWKRAGIEPPMRLGAGVGPEGGGGIDAAEVLDPIREATRTDGLLQSIKDKSKSASKKIGLFSNLSGKMEALASKQTYTAAFSQFMGRAWRRGTGFDRMPVALENALDAIDPNMKNLIYATIESGMSKVEIEDALWGGVTRRAVDNYVPRLAEAYGMNDADVGGMLHQSGVYDFLRGGLEGAESADDVMQVFDDLHEAVSGSLLDRQMDNLENTVQHIRNKIELEGGQAAWRELSEGVFMDEAMMRMSDYHEWEKIFSQREDLTHGQYQAKIERQIARQKTRYKAMYNRHKATYLAIGESFGVDSDVARGLVDQLGQKQELWDGFYTQKWEDIREFYRTYYDTPEQRWAAWDDLRQRHQELYAKTGSLETQIMQQMDEQFVRMVQDSDEFPTGADEIVRRGLERARNVREEMKWDMLIFQDWLDKQEFSDPIERDMEWTKFLNETIRPQIQAKMDESVTWVDDLEAFLREQGETPEIEKAKAALAQEGETVQVPVMMTRDMRQQLVDMGYTIDETKRMTPQEAWGIINAGEPIRGAAGDVRDVASRYGIETATEEGSYKPGADQHILNIVRKWGPEGSREVDSLDQITPEIAEEAFVRRQQARDRQIRLEEAVHGVEEIAETRAAQEDVFAEVLGEPDIVEEALPPTRTQTLNRAYTGIDADDVMTHQEFVKKHPVLKQPLDLILKDLKREAEMHTDPTKSMKRFINEDFGGLSTELRADLTGETGGAITGVPPGFFRESGRHLDYLLTALKEHGYVFEHATLDDVEAMLMAMLREGEDFYPRGYDPEGSAWLHGIGGERAQRLIGQMQEGLENPVRKYPQRIKDEAFGRLLGLMDEPDVYPEGRAYLDIAISEDYWLDEMYKISQELSINPDDIDTPAQMFEDLTAKLPPDASETITQRWFELSEEIQSRMQADETMVDEPTPGAVQADVAAMEQAEIEAMMNRYQDIVRQRSRAGWLMDDWQSSVDDPKALAAGDMREVVRKSAMDIFGYSEEVADAYIELLDARARVWANSNNSTEAEWYRTHVFGFGKGEGGEGGLKGALDQLYQRADQPIWYSRLEQWVDELPQDTMTVDQMRGMLRKGKGIKKDELAWTGFDDWLDAQEGKVTKQEALDYLNNNRVEVQEVTKGSEPKVDPIWQEEITSVSNKLTEATWELEDAQERTFDVLTKNGMPEQEAQRIVDGLGEYQGTDYYLREQSAWNDLNNWLDDNRNQELRQYDFNEITDAAENARSKLQMLDEARAGASRYGTETETKYGEYTLPGGENYRELLLTLPEKGRGVDIVRNSDGDWDIVGRNGEVLSTHPGEFNEYEVWGRSAVPDTTYQSSHWDEPNVLAHVRFDERVDADGKRVLFIEEIQSDWHQAGRERGYRSDVRKTPGLAEDVIDILGRHDDLGHSNSQGALNGVLNEMDWTESYDVADFSVAEIDTVNRWIVEQAAVIKGREGVPQAPFSGSWDELAMKRMMRWAAENGYDRVAWTTGEQQAARYDLSKQVDTLTYYPDDNVLIGYKGADTVVNRTVPPEKLPDYVGKELSQNLLKEDTQVTDYDGRTFHRLEGDDLSVGGAGMKTFYDRILPWTTEKVGKDWGVKVGETEIPGETALRMANEIPAEQVTPDVLRDAASWAKGQGWDESVVNALLNEADRVAGGDELGFSYHTPGYRVSRPVYEALGIPYQDQPKATMYTAHAFDITPEMRASVMEGLPLFQEAKGAVQFLDDGRALIRAMESPDVSTLAHEVGHIFRRDLGGDDLAIAAEWAGADDVKSWNVEAEEKFARGFERYLSEGRAPNAALGKVFEQFKRWLLSIYRTITGSAIDVELNDDIRGVFDRLLDDEAFNATKEGQFDMFGKGEDMPLFSGAAQRAQAETFAPTEQPKTDVLPGMEDAYRPQWEQPKGGAGEGDWFDTEQGPKRLLQGGDESILYQNADGTVETAPIEGETPRFVNGPFGLMDELEAEAPFDRISEEGWNEQIWPMMQTLEGMMLADDTIPTSLADTELDPNVARMLRQYTNQVYGNLSDTKLAAVRHGEMRRDAALLNYNKRRGIDNVVTALLPYQFWYGRSAVQWAKRALDKPSWMANYARLKKMQRHPGHEEMPSRLRGKVRIPMPWLPDWLGDGLYVDPWHQLFPFEQLARPWDQRQENLDMTERQAAYVIQDWLADEEITQAQAAEAMQMREGPLWEKAMTEGRIRVEGENANPFDFIQVLSGYSLPLDMMAKIMDGRPEDISRLPVTRMVEAATAYSTPGGFNLEGGMRKALGWPERGKFGDYFVIRELANMVATGDMPLEVAQRAMVDKQGEAWTRALDRVGKYQATRYWGSALWTDFFPAGEERQRALHDVFVDALESDEPDALTNFFEEYPEFEARLQMRDWEDPQAMMRSFLVGQVWDQWIDADKLTRDKAAERFGETFQYAFLDKETRSYDAIDTETLAIWSRMLGGDDLDMAGPVDQLDPLVDAELAQAYKQYTQAMGEANPGNIEQLQALYFDTPENKRVEFLKRFPQLRKYWDWKNMYLNENPELISELGSSKVKDAPENIQKLYYEYQAARSQHFPNIYAVQSQYFELSKPQRRAFLGQHPELKQYWDWRRAVLEEYPEMEPYLTSRDSMEELIGQDGDGGGGGLWGIGTGVHYHLRPGQAVVKLGRKTSRSEWLSLREHGFRWDPELWAYVGPDSVGSREMLERFEGTFGSGTRSRKPPEPSFDLDGLAPALVRQLMGYYVNGQSLGAGARRALRQEWEAQGKPGGKFSEFVEEILRNEFQ